HGDQLNGGDGDDVLVGDNAYITRNASNGYENIKTIYPDQGGDDVLTAGTGNDLALGDNGSLTYTYQSATNTYKLSLITTTDPTLGDADSILGGDGDDTLL